MESRAAQCEYAERDDLDVRFLTIARSGGEFIQAG